MNRLTDKPIARRRPSAGTAAARVLALAAANAANFRPSLGNFGDPDNMPAKVARVLGPYKNGKTWRVILVEGDRKTNKVFATLEEAQAVVETISASLVDSARMQIDAAIAEFLTHKRRVGLKPVSLRVWQDRLKYLPQTVAVSDIAPRQAQELYDRWTEQLAPTTHHHLLRGVREFFAWIVERDYLSENPFRAVKAIGKSKAGKRQLRVDEARTLIAYLLDQAEAGESVCLGLLLQLMMGLRSSEVRKLKARDVDNGGALLCVAMGDEGGKTDNASRPLEVDDPKLQALLVHQRQGLRPDQSLFSMAWNSVLWKRLRRICDDLELPRVCPHSLRGLCATLAISRGATAGAVAKALGHGNEAVTLRHYIAPGSVQAASIRRVSALLNATEQPGPTEAPEAAAQQALEALRALSPEQLAHVLDSVGERR